MVLVSLQLDISTGGSICRYTEEFCQECEIGTGEYGTVYKCINKLDGCVYAVKKSRDPVTVGRNLP